MISLICVLLILGVRKVWKRKTQGIDLPRDWIKKTIETWLEPSLLVKEGDRIDVSFEKNNNSNKIELIELQTHVRNCLLDKVIQMKTNQVHTILVLEQVGC